ncbi:hypothetical protein [Alkalicoccus chagannorensis]|uniref:hypothetical protein n=1 Tax=Alkalicoccus chagannorensis TaxID=427072 RepID=UPI0003F8BA56|nr:hypothetical protein [Alkalicoccus chagannorensis]
MTEYFTLIAGVSAISLYLICMMDFPLRRGLHLHDPFNGMFKLVYLCYAFFFILLSICTAAFLTYHVGLVMGIIHPAIGVISGIVVLTFFFFATLNVVEGRSKREAILFSLAEKPNSAA